MIESVAIGGNPAALIKSHHNVGGLPKKMKFKLVEPLRELFKDEVREVGAQLGLPKEIVQRQPFPGPGLAVRILGEITRERLRILREADTIVVSEMKASDWYYKVWQSFAVLLPVRSVGVMGDERTYENTIAVRIVESQDGMTADWVRLPYELLARISHAHHQRSQRRQPRLLRHQQQAAGDDRVGMNFLAGTARFLAWIVALGCVAWASGALCFDLPRARMRTAGRSLFSIVMFSPSRAGGAWTKARCVAFAGFALVLAAWWLTLKPSNDGNWQPDVAQTAWAEINGDEVTLHNVRNCDYRTETDYTPRWETRTVRLSQTHRHRHGDQLLGLAVDGASHRQLPVRRRAAGLLFDRDAQGRSARATPPSAASIGSSS